MKTSIAIFTNDFNNIDNVIQQIKSQHKNYDDIVVFSDFNMHNKHIEDYSIFSTFYMKFFPGKVFFLNDNDFKNYDKKILGECLLYGDNLV